MRGQGQIVHYKRAYEWQSQSLERPTFRNPLAPPELSPGSMLYKGDGKYGVTSVVVFAKTTLEREWSDFFGGYYHPYNFRSDSYFRWDGEKEFRSTSVVSHRTTVGIYQFISKYIPPPDPPADLSFFYDSGGSARTRLRPASGVNEKLRLCMTAVFNIDRYKPADDPSIEYMPQFTAIVSQVGGATKMKKFTPKYKKYHEKDEPGMFEPWECPDATEDDVCLTITFGPKGELVSVK